MVGGAGDQSSASDRLVDLIDSSRVWPPLHREYAQRIDRGRFDQVLRLVAIDIEMRVAVAPGGVYEYYWSERGNSRMEMKTQSLEMLFAFLVLRGFGLRSMSFMRECEFNSPPAGFRFTWVDDDTVLYDTVLVEWGSGSAAVDAPISDAREEPESFAWAEFCDGSPLRTALRTIRLLQASEADLQIAARSQNGFPLMLRDNPNTPCGPGWDDRGRITVDRWQEWLRGRAAGGT